MVQRIVQSLLTYGIVHHVEVFQPVACFALVDAPEGLVLQMTPSPSSAFVELLFS